jgi:hypothetical protein
MLGNGETEAGNTTGHYGADILKVHGLARLGKWLF